MADSTSAEQANEAGTWHTVEHAAVALGLSVRTVNRHIQAGKLRSRLAEGRREVFVPAPPIEDEAPSASSDSTSDEPVKPDGQQTPSDPPQAAQRTQPPSSSTASPELKGTTSSVGGQPIPPFANAVAYDVESALARADNAADKAELAVSAYQNLAHSIELQAQSARRGAKVAWTIVAVLAVAAGVATYWTATTVTEARMKAEELEREAKAKAEELERETRAASKAAEDNSAELERLRARLSNAEHDAAYAKGKAEVLEHAQSQRPSTGPTTLLEKISSAFTSPAPSAPAPDH